MVERVMITVTDHAKQALKAILVAREADLDEGLRLMPSPDGEFVLAPDTTLPGDDVVEYAGFKVLLVGIEYFKLLNGKTVDCLETEDGEVLFVR